MHHHGLDGVPWLIQMPANRSWGQHDEAIGAPGHDVEPSAAAAQRLHRHFGPPRWRHRRQAVDVDGKRRPSATGMAEAAGNGLEVDPGTQEAGSPEVAQVVGRPWSSPTEWRRRRNLRLT